MRQITVRGARAQEAHGQAGHRFLVAIKTSAAGQLGGWLPTAKNLGTPVQVNPSNLLRKNLKRKVETAIVKKIAQRPQSSPYLLTASLSARAAKWRTSSPGCKFGTALQPSHSHLCHKKFQARGDLPKHLRSKMHEADNIPILMRSSLPPEPGVSTEFWRISPFHLSTIRRPGLLLSTSYLVGLTGLDPM